MANPKDLKQQGLEQLAEKQMEEMQQMPIVHTDDRVRASTFSELFSGIPSGNEDQE